MSNPTSIYSEIRRGSPEKKTFEGIQVGFLTYNDALETQSTLSQCNFNEAYKQHFGHTPEGISSVFLQASTLGMQWGSQQGL